MKLKEKVYKSVDSPALLYGAENGQQRGDKMATSGIP